MNTPETCFDFIIYSTDNGYSEECMKYLEYLNVPEGCQAQIYSVQGEQEQAADVFDEAIAQTEGEYKIFLTDRCFILNRNLIADVKEIFEEEKIGALGVCDGEGEAGGYILLDGNRPRAVGKIGAFQKGKKKSSYVSSLAGGFLAVRCAGKQGADAAEEPGTVTGAAVGAALAGKAESLLADGCFLAVPYQSAPWCMIESVNECVQVQGYNKPVDKRMVENILEIHNAEKAAGKELFCRAMDWSFFVAQYRLLKLFLRRIENGFDAADIDGFYETFDKGGVSAEAVEYLLKHEVFYARRTEHYIQNHSHVSALPFIPDSAVAGKRMNIALSLNRKYVPFVCVLMESVCRSNRLADIYVYVLHCELTEEDKETLRRQGERKNAKVEFLFVDKSLFYGFYETEAWTAEAYFRLQMIKLLPKDVERILYLDCDTLVLKPLYEFYFADFEGQDIIGCRDMGSSIPFGDSRDEMFKDYIGSANFTYCNSGVMLWNIEKLRRRTGLVEEYMRLAEKYNYEMTAPDQDLINLVHAGKIKVVEEYQYDLFARMVYDMSSAEVRSHTAILHYSGYKPWDGRAVRIDMDRLWWEYARETQMYHALLEDAFFEGIDTEIKLYEQCRNLAEQMK